MGFRPYGHYTLDAPLFPIRIPINMDREADWNRYVIDQLAESLDMDPDWMIPDSKLGVILLGHRKVIRHGREKVLADIRRALGNSQEFTDDEWNIILPNNQIHRSLREIAKGIQDVMAARDAAMQSEAAPVSSRLHPSPSVRIPSPERVPLRPS